MKPSVFFSLFLILLLHPSATLAQLSNDDGQEPIESPSNPSTGITTSTRTPPVESPTGRPPISPTATATQTSQTPPRPTEPVIPPNFRGESFIQPVRLNQCANRCVRKEISDLTPDEWNRFASAVRALHNAEQQVTLWPQVTAFEAMANTHVRFMGDAHNNPAFFPWHRLYLAQFEKALQAIDRTVCLPYWDWSKVSQNYRASRMWQLIGSARSGCISDGPFAGWVSKSQLVPQGCVRRTFAPNILHATSYVVALMNATTDYELFRQRFESTFHALPHVSIGGLMTSMGSPADPIFYLHHAYVDKVWDDYNQIYLRPRNQPLYPGNLINSPIRPFNIPAGAIMDTEPLCYTYGESRLPMEQNPRLASGVPAEWLQMNNFNQSQISEIQNDTTKLLNETKKQIDAGTQFKLPPRPPSNVYKKDGAGFSASVSLSVLLGAVGASAFLLM